MNPTWFQHHCYAKCCTTHCEIEGKNEISMKSTWIQHEFNTNLISIKGWRGETLFQKYPKNKLYLYCHVFNELGALPGITNQNSLFISAQRTSMHSNNHKRAEVVNWAAERGKFLNSWRWTFSSLLARTITFRLAQKPHGRRCGLVAMDL